uniref:Serine/threonine-protein kinase MARK2 n=1 Tax=Vombatus ursinus TaxID=29139 RepID=A0A4X2K6V9_VOMUR
MSLVAGWSGDRSSKRPVLGVLRDHAGEGEFTFFFPEESFPPSPGIERVIEAERNSVSLTVCASFLQPALGHLDAKPSSKANMLRGRNSATSADEQPHIGNYRLLKTIGKGNFAKVKLARHVLTGKEVAVKIIDKTQLNSSSLQKLFREVRIMKVLNHPNIVKLFEVIETEKTLYLVMEYASGGEVFDYLVAHGRMKEKEARAKFRQIVSAVQYCHQKFIVHRDLKAENLLLDADMNIKIADFGFSNEFTFGTKLDTFCGSPPYAAPELFQGKKYDGPEVDVWSLGVILYTLVSGSLPFDGQNLKELRERVLRGKYRIPFYMSTDCENLLKKFLILNPSKRGTLEQIMKDRWMNVGHEEDELKPYVEPLPDYKDPRRTELMVSMGYTREEIQDSLVGQKYNEVMATYLLLGYKSSELEGETIALKPRPSAELTNSSAPSPSHKVQRSVSANPKQRRFSDQAGPAIPTSNSYSKKTQSNNAENRRPEEERESGRKASSTAKVPASPLPGLERKKTTPTPSTNSVLSTSTNRSRNSPLLERASLGQSSVQNGKDSLTMPGSRASTASASAAVSAARPRQHQKSMSASVHPNKASGLPPTDSNCEVPRPRQVCWAAPPGRCSWGGSAWSLSAWWELERGSAPVTGTTQEAEGYEGSSGFPGTAAPGLSWLLSGVQGTKHSVTQGSLGRTLSLSITVTPPLHTPSRSHFLLIPSLLPMALGSLPFAMAASLLPSPQPHRAVGLVWKGFLGECVCPLTLPLSPQYRSPEGPCGLPLSPQHQQQRGSPGTDQLPSGGVKQKHLPCRPAAPGAGSTESALWGHTRLSFWPQPRPTGGLRQHLQQIHLQVCSQKSVFQVCQKEPE